MKVLTHRLLHALAVFLDGWSYDRWDPPYPGDGI
jgi:hypothetical protein